MKLLRTMENSSNGFNLYFLGYHKDVPSSTSNGVNPTADKEGVLELTWNVSSSDSIICDSARKLGLFELVWMDLL